MSLIILTNNEKVKTLERDRLRVEYENIEYRDILVKVRDYIHRGHTLVSHPLAGSIKPKETPFRSVILSGEVGALDFHSLEIIENSIVTCDKFDKRYEGIPERIREDFAAVDFDLMQNAVRDRD